MAAVTTAATRRSGVGAGGVRPYQWSAHRRVTACVTARKRSAKAIAKAVARPPTAPRRAPTLPPPRVPPRLRRQAVPQSHPDGGGGAQTNGSSLWSGGGGDGGRHEKWTRRRAAPMRPQPAVTAVGCYPHHPGCDAVHRGWCDHGACGRCPQPLGAVTGCGGGLRQSWSLTATRAHPFLCCCCRHRHHPPAAAAVADHHRARSYVAGGSGRRRRRTARRWRGRACSQAPRTRRCGLAGVGAPAREPTGGTAGSHGHRCPVSRGSAKKRCANGSEMMVCMGGGSRTGCGCGGGRGSRCSSREWSGSYG